MRGDYSFGGRGPERPELLGRRPVVEGVRVDVRCLPDERRHHLDSQGGGLGVERVLVKVQ